MVRASNLNEQSDADLTKRIGIAFTTRPRITWHDIHVSACEGIVTLQGELPSGYDRQLVLAITRHVAGVFGIIDKLNVAETAPGSQPPQAFDATRPGDARPTTGLPRKETNPRPETRPRGIVGRFLRAGMAAVAVAAIALADRGSESNRAPVHPATGAIQFRGQPTIEAFVLLPPKEGVVNGTPRLADQDGGSRDATTSSPRSPKSSLI